MIKVHVKINKINKINFFSYFIKKKNNSWEETFGPRCIIWYHD